MDGRLTRAIFVTTLAVYLLTSGREPPWGDGNVQYMAAESMVRRGAVDIPVPWPDDMPKDADGKWYSTYPLLTSVVHFPGLALLAVTPQVMKRLTKPLTSHLACSLFGALTCVLFFRLCRQRKLSLRASSLATVIVAFGTQTWVYAHYSYSEIAQTCAFTGLVLWWLRTDEEPTKRNARWLGFYAGFLFATKFIYLPGIAVSLLLLLWRHRALKKDLVPLALHAAAFAAPFLIGTMVFNALCFGSPFATGYAEYFDKYWGENSMTRLWAMFLSPGKSIYLYSPPLILGIAALPRMWREHRAACLAVLSAGAPVLFVYSRYKLNGDWAWGYRFCVFIVPALALSVGVLVDQWLKALTSIRTVILAIALGAGVVVQILGCALYWDHFTRISQDVRVAWLGQPNRSGAIIPQRRNGRCDGCFEDVHQLEWLPPFQPIVGQWWLAKSLVLGDTPEEAEATGPWHRYTSVTFNITDSYNRARLDWWGMLFITDFPSTRPLGIAILIALLGTSVFGIILWRRALRRSPPEDPPPAE